jgi:excinuclease UvrABC nuclease subunit
VSASDNKILREKLPTDPGVYRWLFPAEGSEKPGAYVGEGENLRVRVSDYLKAASEPVTSAAEDSFREEELREAIKTIRRCSVFRIGEYLARKSAHCNVQLQRLRIMGEEIILRSRD